MVQSVIPHLSDVTSLMAVNLPYLLLILPQPSPPTRHLHSYILCLIAILDFLGRIRRCQGYSQFLSLASTHNELHAVASPSMPAGPYLYGY